jgi:hypothetical protein
LKLCHEHSDEVLVLSHFCLVILLHTMIFAFHCVEEGPSNSLPKGGNMEETGAMIAEDNAGGTGEFEGEDEIDWEEG